MNPAGPVAEIEVRMASNPKKQTREERLRSALRDNLKKRKVQTRKVGGNEDKKSVSLRDRDVVTHREDTEKS